MKREEKEIIIRIEPKKKGGFILQVFNKTKGTFFIYHEEADRIKFESTVWKAGKEPRR